LGGCLRNIKDSEEINDNSAPQAEGGYSLALRQTTQPVSSARQLTLCFRRLAYLDNGFFERLERYESAIAKQVLKTLFVAVGTRPMKHNDLSLLRSGSANETLLGPGRSRQMRIRLTWSDSLSLGVRECRLD
jgi:hypothetical protein